MKKKLLSLYLSFLTGILIRLNLSIIVNVNVINDDGNVDINLLKENGILSECHFKDCIIRNKDGKGFYGAK